MKIESADVIEALKHYGVHVASGHADHSGTAIVILGETGAADGRTIEVRGGAPALRRMVPLGESGAEILAMHLHGEGHPGTSDSARRMLEHVLLRCSAMFEDYGLESFRLDVRLRDNSYTVVQASMTAPAALHVKKRLSPHAHDRKGNAYRPSGGQ
jgi:hypothetical protein